MKLLAIELHAGDMSVSSHREACQSILVQLFGQEIIEMGADHIIPRSLSLQNGSVEHGGTRTISKSKVFLKE